MSHVPPAGLGSQVSCPRANAHLTSGGRVLCVTALGDTVRQAQKRAYDAAGAIRFAGAQYRRDIGWRAVR